MAPSLDKQFLLTCAFQALDASRDAWGDKGWRRACGQAGPIPAPGPAAPGPRPSPPAHRALPQHSSHSRSLCPNLAGAGVGRGPWRGAALWLHVTVAAKVSPVHKCGPRWAAAELQAQRVLHHSSRLRFLHAPPAQSSPPLLRLREFSTVPPRLTRLTGYPTPAAQEAGPEVR